MTSFAPQKRTKMQKYRPLVGLLALMLATLPFLIYKSATYTRSTLLNDIRTTSAHTLDLVVENLRGELIRFQALPHLLAVDQAYLALWNPNKTPEDLQRINLMLETNKNITGALELYILDTDGKTIAASNWRSKYTFIGDNFSFRPYFRDAMQGTEGRYFALGMASQERGYYFSWPIRKGNKILGVVVCKLAVGHFETAWKSKHNEIIVTDHQGIIFMSSNDDWRYGSLRPLSQKQKDAIALDRQYAETKIKSLLIKKQRSFKEGGRLIEIVNADLPDTRKARGSSFPPDDASQINMQYLMLGRDMKKAGWRVHILAKTLTVQTQIWRNAIATTIFLLGLFAAIALFLERARRIREGIEIQQQARAELEYNVELRTRELQKAQDELVQASRMAALGKISAGLSHELNQPLAAIRSYADNADIFLQRGQSEPAAANLKNIGELTDRMARIIKHLRIYASKEKIEAGPIDLRLVIKETLAILAHRIDQEKVTIIDELPQRPILVHGGLVRLQQVFINIVSNALDALANAPQKQIILTLEESQNMQIIEVCDTGPGLDENELNHAFDPFFSTKEVGQGVGLGLSISYGIIQQFGGHLEITNCKNGPGAALKVALREAK
ncbi:MAG: ATP-binding protein [Hyphomicrobiaceae bacterium]|nr:ATP-binding protein [Hyphomicrobiaceae bacterium]